MRDSSVGFETFDDWFANAPDMGNEYFPKPESISETYEQWLNNNPEGYIC